MIDIHLVCGFLGSGKTTLLREVARRYPHRRWVFLVNEFAQMGVDAVALKDCGIPVMEVVGGSLFCQCRVEHFIKELNRLPELFGEVDGLFVETTGMADPRVIGRLLKDCGMDRLYRLAQVICVVAPKRFLSVAESLPVVKAQVEAASCVVLNQLDLSTAAQLEEVRHMIEELRPGISVKEAHYCDVSVLDELADVPMLQGNLSVSSNPFTSFELKSGKLCSPEKLAIRLAALGEGVYRAKGVLYSGDGNILFDWKGGNEFIARPLNSGADEANRTLVVLVDDACADVLREQVEGLLD